MLKGHGIRISMDGKGRAPDNRMIERLWRIVKYDDIYIKGYKTMGELRQGAGGVFQQVKQGQTPDPGDEPAGVLLR